MHTVYILTVSFLYFSLNFFYELQVKHSKKELIAEWYTSILHILNLTNFFNILVKKNTKFEITTTVKPILARFLIHYLQIDFHLQLAQRHG